MPIHTQVRTRPATGLVIIFLLGHGFALWSCGGSGARQQDAAQTDVEPAITVQADSAWTQVAQDWDSFCVQAGTLMAKRTSECTLAQPTASTVRQPFCDSIAASILAGRVSFVDANSQPCLDSLQSMSCDNVLPNVATSDFLPVLCPQVLQGELKLDDSCTQDEDCADPTHLFCLLIASCTGTCQPRPGLGQSCSYGVCASGLICATDSGTCVPTSSEGQPCGGSQGVCDPWLVCDASGTCTKYAGHSCAQGEWFPCGLFMRCEGDDAGAKTCAAFRKLGETCVPGAAECLNNTFCSPADGGGICTEHARLGEACGPVLQGAEIIESNECMDGYCDRQLGALSGTCQPFRQLGEACLSDAECDLGAQRRCASGVCRSEACR